LVMLFLSFACYLVSFIFIVKFLVVFLFILITLITLYFLFCWASQHQTWGFWSLLVLWQKICMLANAWQGITSIAVSRNAYQYPLAAISVAICWGHLIGMWLFFYFCVFSPLSTNICCWVWNSIILFSGHL
jgi:hypothetical protein